MKIGTIHRLVNLFTEAFEHLQVRASPQEVESLAVLVHKAMTVQARKFHSLEHVFQFSEPSDPIQTVAALFHDIIYYQIDQGFMPEIWAVIEPYVQVRQGEFYIAEHIPADDLLFWLTLKIFGFTAGQPLSIFGGLNEFLSALLMNKKLERLIAARDLARMTVCIEATIPFRGHDAQGRSHFEVLEDRLCQASERCQLACTCEEIRAAIQLAVVFSNKDVENFAEREAAKFLDNTWRLLPETNVSLRSPDVYSIRDYRQALHRMLVFLRTLNPDNVFHTYQGIPAPRTYRQMVGRAYRNIYAAREYLEVKLQPIAMLEALAEATGGDAPLSLFMGDLPQGGEKVRRIEDFLPDMPTPDYLSRGSSVFRILIEGRISEPGFDLRRSPLSTFIYKSLDPAALQQHIVLAEQMFRGELAAHDYLRQVDPWVLSVIAKGAAAMALTRRARLLPIAHARFTPGVRGQAVAEWKISYPEPLVVKTGELVNIGRQDTEWANWVWCTNQADQGGWIPEAYIERQGDVGRMRLDYSSAELALQPGDALTLHREASGWYWATSSSGQSGWAPGTHVIEERTTVL